MAPIERSGGQRVSTRSVRYGWVRTRSRSLSFRVPDLSQMPVETPSAPRSWSSAARSTSRRSAAGRPSRPAASAASRATPRECPVQLGRLEIGEVGDGEQHGRQLRLGELAVEAGDRADHLVPRRRLVDLVEDLIGTGAHQVDERRVELGAAAGAQLVDGGLDAAAAGEHLGVVCHLDDAHHGVDLVAGPTAGHAAAVPPLERLGEHAADLVEAQPGGDQRRRLAVRQHRRGDLARAAGDEPADHRQPVHRRRSGTEVTDHEAHQRQAGLVEVIRLVTHPQVVAEPLGQLVGIGHATHPGEQRCVVHRRLLVLAQAGGLGEARRRSRSGAGRGPAAGRARGRWPATARRPARRAAHLTGPRRRRSRREQAQRANRCDGAFRSLVHPDLRFVSLRNRAPTSVDVRWRWPRPRSRRSPAGAATHGRSRDATADGGPRPRAPSRLRPSRSSASRRSAPPGR